MGANKEWNTFLDSGLLMLVNQILHAFGWVICVVTDDATGKAVSAFPCRTKMRGFTEEATTSGYKKIGKFIAENVEYITKVDD